MSLSSIQTLKTPKQFYDLAHNFNLIPFFPAKIVDFTTHANLFHALGLSEFAGLDFSGLFRPNYLIELFANYDMSMNRSIVAGVEISLGREDLATALRLPLNKKEDISDTQRDIFSKGESKKVLQDFLSAYVLLEAEDEDDILILPEEAVVANRLVKDGRPDEIDWAGLMSVLVKKELMDVFKAHLCRHASHLQRLMQFQQPHLFVKVEYDDLTGMNLGSMDTFNEIDEGLGTGFHGYNSDQFYNMDEFMNSEMMTSFMPIANCGDGINVASSQMRYNGAWEEPTLGFESCIGEAEMTMCKARMSYAEKEVAVYHANMEIQRLSAILEHKDQVIRCYEHEIGNLKEALKEEQNRFDEYRRNI